MRTNRRVNPPALSDHLPQSYDCAAALLFELERRPAHDCRSARGVSLGTDSAAVRTPWGFSTSRTQTYHCTAPFGQAIGRGSIAVDEEPRRGHDGIYNYMVWGLAIPAAALGNYMLSVTGIRTVAGVEAARRLMLTLWCKALFVSHVSGG